MGQDEGMRQTEITGSNCNLLGVSNAVYLMGQREHGEAN